MTIINTGRLREEWLSENLHSRPLLLAYVVSDDRACSPCRVYAQRDQLNLILSVHAYATLT